MYWPNGQPKSVRQGAMGSGLLYASVDSRVEIYRYDSSRKAATLLQRRKVLSLESPQPGLSRRYPSISPNVFEGFFPILSHSMPQDLPIKSSTMPQVA